ncbi:MAG: hypothetical protein ACNA8W_16080 [Bradymonadaceae bacterium]
MADEKDKTPSADEIVDNLAAEMGVENETVPETEEADEKMMAGLGGIFDVTNSGGKKKKKKKPPEEDKPKKDKPKKAKIAGVEGVFSPESKDDAPIDLADVDPDFLGDGDLDGYVPREKNPMIKVMALVIVLLVALVAGILWKTTDTFDDLGLLLRGDFREAKLAAKTNLEEEHRRAQIEALETFGNLQITGNPWHALVTLNGEVQYGETSSGHWRELRVGSSTVFQNLKTKEDHQVSVSAPGFIPQTYQVTRGMWQRSPAGMDYQYTLTANLLPEDQKRYEEFNRRMDADLDNEFYGKVSIVTIPSGARVVFNNHILLDKDGNELTTPVTFDKYFVRNEENNRLEENQVRVDTPPDRGHKIEIEFPDNDDLPKYVTALQRRMWDCEWKDEAAIKRLPSKASIQHQCNYKWNLELDINGLKRYIAAREAELERIEAQRKEAQADRAAQAEDDDQG